MGACSPQHASILLFSVNTKPLLPIPLCKHTSVCSKTEVGVWTNKLCLNGSLSFSNHSWIEWLFSSWKPSKYPCVAVQKKKRMCLLNGAFNNSGPYTQTSVWPLNNPSPPALHFCRLFCIYGELSGAQVEWQEVLPKGSIKRHMTWVQLRNNTISRTTSSYLHIKIIELNAFTSNIPATSCLVTKKKMQRQKHNEKTGSHKTERDS